MAELADQRPRYEQLGLGPLIEAAREEYARRNAANQSFLTDDALFRDTNGELIEERSPQTFLNSRLADRFQAIHYLQSGTFARGWKCVDGVPGTPAPEVFIKTFRSANDRPQPDLSPEYLAHLSDETRKEIELLLRPEFLAITHENIINNYACFGKICNLNTGVERFGFFAVSPDLCIGELFDFLCFQTRPYVRAFSESTALAIFSQIVAGVGYLHSHGIYHRDLKLENILVDGCIEQLQQFAQNPTDENLAILAKNPRNFTIKITDFGTARLDGDLARIQGPQGEMVFATTRVGTVQYQPPELIKGHPQYDPAAFDCWSLGVILFFLCGIEEMVSTKVEALPGMTLNFDLFRYIAQGLRGYRELLDNIPMDFQSLAIGGEDIIVSKHSRLWTRVARQTAVRLHHESPVTHLLNGILNVDPTQRFNINHIQTHPWVQAAGQVNRTDYVLDMANRYQRRGTGRWVFRLRRQGRNADEVAYYVERDVGQVVMQALRNVPAEINVPGADFRPRRQGKHVIFGNPPLIQAVARDGATFELVWLDATLQQWANVLLALIHSDIVERAE